MNKSRYCSFYVSDVHLITMLLPYINEKMKEGKEFITIFETDISESAKKVIKSVSLKRKEEQAFIDIGWKNKIDLKELSKVNLKGPTVLVMGSEGKGIHQLTRKLVDGIVTIRMHGKVNSLNVGSATAIALYEVNRQRTL